MFCLLFLVILIKYAAVVLTQKSEWNLTEVISQYNYPTEVHEIETEDGYLLDTYRIPYGRKSISKIVNKLPVVVMHGMLGSAENFILTGPKKALAYKLADNGYDVWLCNARGSWHSRKHKSLNPDTDKQFWQFSWHEIGVYDLPAIIDYVLKATNNTKLHYVGHSQGATSFFVMASERPEYNEKIRIMLALSPGVLFNHFNHPILNLLIPFYQFLKKLLSDLNIYEVFPFISLETVHTLEKILCEPRSNLIGLCKFLIGMIVDEEQLDWSTVPLITATAPAGCSINQIAHYAQLIISGEFQNYDWGPKENMRRYGTKTPPKYNLRKVIAPIAIFYGENDNLVNVQDIEQLAEILPNVVELYKVPYKKWTHIDFIIAKDMDSLLNGKVLETMKKYNV